MKIEVAAKRPDQKAKQIIKPKDFKNLFVPNAYQTGIINYANAVLSQGQNGSELDNPDIFAEMLRDKMLKINEYAGETGVKGMVILVANQPLDKTIATSDQFRPEDVAETWVYDSYRVGNDGGKPFKPSFNKILGESYKSGDNPTFRLMLALMTNKDSFRSMVRGLGQYYDGKGLDLKYFDDYVQGDETQIDNINKLPDGQYAADPQVAFAIDGNRRAIRQAGSEEVPNTPFDNLYVRTPVGEQHNGRVKDADGDWVVPFVRPYWVGDRRSGLGGRDGDAYSSFGWVAVDEVKNL